jgi:hypothetical protein
MFQRSSFCRTDQPMCVEVDLADAPARVRVRDSKKPTSPVLTFTGDEWDAFIAGVKAGEFSF